MGSDTNNFINEYTSGEYKYGFHTEIETEYAPVGLTEDTIRYISARKNEPEFMLEYRLKAYRHWLTLKMPTWAHLEIPPISFQDIIYYAAPKRKPELSSLDEVDPELLATFNKLGISLEEQKKLAGVAVDAVVDSVSVKTTFSETLSKYGIIFCSFSEAVQKYPDLVKQYMGSVAPIPITFLPRSTRQSSATGHFVISRRMCGARSSSPPTSGSTQPIPGSLNGP